MVNLDPLGPPVEHDCGRQSPFVQQKSALVEKVICSSAETNLPLHLSTDSGFHPIQERQNFGRGPLLPVDRQFEASVPTP